MSRFARQLELVPPDKLAKQNILLVGAGAVGRNLGNTLAALGAKKVSVVDFDTIEKVNICTQGYTKKELGKSKSEVLARLMKELDYEGDAEFNSDNNPWRPSKYKDDKFDVVFSCVDRMDVRKSIHTYCLNNEVNLLIDSRMLGENLRLLCYTKKNMAEYSKTLYTDEEAIQGRCTQQSTMWAASALAQLMAGHLSLYLRGYKSKQDQSINLLDTLLG